MRRWRSGWMEPFLGGNSAGKYSSSLKADSEAPASASSPPPLKGLSKASKAVFFRQQSAGLLLDLLQQLQSRTARQKTRSFLHGGAPGATSSGGFPPEPAPF